MKETADQISRLASATPEEAGLTHRAVRENWAGVDRWDLRQPEPEIAKEIEQGGATIDSRTRLTVLQDLNSNDPLVRAQARRAAIAMKDHNNKHVLSRQRIESGDSRDPDFPSMAAPLPVPVQVNVQVNNNGTPTAPEPEGVVIVQRSDFYRNDAHTREHAREFERDCEQQRAAAADSPEALAASAPGLNIAGPVQAADLRETVRQNGHGANGHDSGPRSNGNGHSNGHHTNGSAGSH